MEMIDTILLCLLEGLTEFLPVSSYGHLVLAQNWLAIEVTSKVALSAFSQFAIAGALMIYFSTDVWILFQAALRKLSRLPVNEKDLCLFNALAVGAVPAIGFVLIQEFIIETLFANVMLVAATMFAAAIFFMYVEWRSYLRPESSGITRRRGLLIGLLQILTLLPGFSRIGAAMGGGMLLGLSRFEAAKFSFLLAIPVTLLLGCKKCIELLEGDAVVDWPLVFVGAITAAIGTFVVTHLFLNFIRKNTLWPFIWYNVLLSAFVAYAAFVTI